MRETKRYEKNKLKHICSRKGLMESDRYASYGDEREGMEKLRKWRQGIEKGKKRGGNGMKSK